MAGGMHDRRACVAEGSMHGRGACMAGGGAGVLERWPLKRAVRILPECILVVKILF